MTTLHTIPADVLDRQIALRRMLCDFGNPGTACDCWKGENCPKVTPLSRLGKLEAEIIKLFSHREEKRNVVTRYGEILR